MGHQILAKENEISNSIDYTNVIWVNVCGAIMMTTEVTLVQILRSICSVLFNGRRTHN